MKLAELEENHSGTTISLPIRGNGNNALDVLTHCSDYGDHKEHGMVEVPHAGQINIRYIRVHGLAAVRGQLVEDLLPGFLGAGNVVLVHEFWKRRISLVVWRELGGNRSRNVTGEFLQGTKDRSEKERFCKMRDVISCCVKSTFKKITLLNTKLQFHVGRNKNK